MTGEPLAHARIRFFKEMWVAEGSYGATTNADGRFSIQSVPPGEYKLLVERHGFISFWPKEDDLSATKRLKPGEEVEDLIFRLLSQLPKLPDGAWIKTFASTGPWIAQEAQHSGG